jgi:hypothetical protein
VKKPLLIILANENPDDHELWLKACESRRRAIEYRVINLCQADWFDRIMEYKDSACFLSKPSGISSIFKQLYDERLIILSKCLHLAIYPALEECLLYENKRLLSYWLLANKVSHPQTFVFYNKQEALSALYGYDFPLVAKTNIGASGSGVRILQNINDSKEYIRSTFDGKGASRRFGPNMERKGIIKRGIHYVFHPVDIGKKLRKYKAVKQDIQNKLVILQEFIHHEFEWRVVRIGESFFAHKKILHNNKASGSLTKGYENPPMELLEFVKTITDKHKFYSLAVDIFETDKGYLVNEMQCIFGQSDPYQMLVDGNPGRYIFKNNKWLFEAGDFTQNQCYDLRLDHVLRNLL